MRNKDENKAKNILINNSWFRDYYYIKEVIESCIENVLITNGVYNPIKTIMNARRWGFNLLRNKIDGLCDRYPTLDTEIRSIYYTYMDDLRNIFESSFNKISNKLDESNG